MKWFALKNLKSQDVFELDPRTAKPAPPFVDEEGNKEKKQFRAWCANDQTDHCFYNHVEGLSPSSRITRDNPPMYLHGFTADYDAVQSQADAKVLLNKNALTPPRWMSTTFSGGVRLTWEFETPVLADNKLLMEQFMKELGKEIGVEKIALNFDKSSFELSQYWEAGKDWTDLGSPPVKSKVLAVVFFRAANKTKIQGDSVIPLEDVATEVEKRWPGRAEITAGARVPLFWVEPFEDRIGAQVGDHGMLCYSSRAGKSFVTWGEILGMEFMKNYQAARVGEAAEGVFYDGQNYWRHDNSWRKRNVEEMQRWLRVSGISPKPVKGSNFGSEIDMVLLAAQAQNEVKAAVPLVHHKNRIAVINGEKFLNISEKSLVRPAESGDPKHFPFLYNFIHNIFDDPQEKQRESYLSWLRYAYKQALEGDPAQGQAVIIAGPVSVGKTFWNLRVLGTIFGGSADPTEYLLGATNFNKDLAESYIWACDDSRVSSSWENKVHFANNLKKHVANPQIRCEGKFRDAVVVPWYGRIEATCNLNKSSLEIIPHLDSTIFGKLNLYQWRQWSAPFLPAHGSDAVAIKELPSFLKWLLEWVPPASVVADNPRFGVKHYHHPNLLAAAVDAGSGARLREMVEIFYEESTEVADAKKAEKKIWATPAKLRKLLAQEPSFRDNLREFGKNRMDMALEELQLPSRKASTSSTQYLIYDPEKSWDELCDSRKKVI
jgi:uncharacterized protein DUF5906